MNFDAFVLSIKTDDLIRDLNKFHDGKGLFAFNKIDNEHLLYCIENADVNG